MLKFIQTTLLGLIFFTSYAQNETSYQDNVKNCFNSLMTLIEDPLERFNAFSSCYIGMDAPSYEVTTMEGKVINSDQLEGKVVVLNFWFQNCTPCIAEMPGLEYVNEKYKNDRFIMLSICKDYKKDVLDWLLAGNQVSYPLIPDAESLVVDTFQARSGFPTTIVIDKNNIIQDYFSGGRTDEKAIEEIKDKLIPLIDVLLEK